MPLQSKTLSGDERLEACLVQDSAHLTRGTTGEAVAKVQAALIFLDDAAIDRDELLAETYGPSTAAAVLAYKTARKIINTSYQQTADEIVGKMTIRALDDELLIAEARPPGSPRGFLCA
ncbi:peptidoglycan-binding domain-containing protein [Arvimicrobium flavum]|uniref:peptidoglycan-binding domain-containing protein n=1 Tax=Arvimicrobium flavum TaxID=3393320 RepID=UPI00237C2920|nr:hypothetical protein [Mesorhizobium shangrilense]